MNRELGRKLIKARRLLLAKVVVSLRDESEAGLRELERLQAEFEKVVYSLPVSLRLKVNLERAVLKPAERILARQGVIATGRQMRGWDL